MKRYLCSEHIYRLRKEGKSIQLSTDQCSICRYEKRPMTLKDAANQFEDIAYCLRFAHDNPDYDPFGFSFMPQLEETLTKFLKSVHIDYRKGLIERITTACLEKENRV